MAALSRFAIPLSQWSRITKPIAAGMTRCSLAQEYETSHQCIRRVCFMHHDQQRNDSPSSCGSSISVVATGTAMRWTARADVG